MSGSRAQNTVELAASVSLLIRNKQDCVCLIVFLAVSGRFWGELQPPPGLGNGQAQVLSTPAVHLWTQAPVLAWVTNTNGIRAGSFYGP